MGTWCEVEPILTAWLQDVERGMGIVDGNFWDAI